MLSEERYIAKFFSTCHKNLKLENIFYKSSKKVFSYKDIQKFYKKFSSFLYKFTNERKKIAIISSKKFDLYACILSVIVSKNIWIPINPSLPILRIKKIIEISKPNILILENLKEKSLANIIKICKKKNITVTDFSNIKKIKNKKFYSERKVNSEDISMIFFTSGSTGEPKGVKINYRGFLHSMYEQKRILFKNKKNLIFGDYHDPSFVISLNILLLCFLTRNTIAPSTNPYDSVMPVNHMEKNKVNVLITVPSTILRIQKYIKNQKIKNRFELVVMCGEPFHLDLYEFILGFFKSKKIFNCYGSTELSPWVFSHECDQQQISKYKKYALIPIGKPFNFTKAIIRKNELLISGKMLSSGYLVTNENKNKFIKIENQVWYKTGDLVKVHNQVFTIKGRSDRIIKVKGYRVDLLEIEKYIKDFDKNISDVISFSKNDNNENKIFSIIESEKKISTDNLVLFLKKFIPSYMIPKDFFYLKKFKTNKNGKVDRKNIIKKF